MQGIVNGEQPFKCLKNTVAIGPTSQGFVLNFAVSKDGPWTAHSEETPANECCVINGLTPYMWLKLEGNTEDVEVIL